MGQTARLRLHSDKGDEVMSLNDILVANGSTLRISMCWANVMEWVLHILDPVDYDQISMPL